MKGSSGIHLIASTLAIVLVIAEARQGVFFICIALHTQVAYSSEHRNCGDLAQCISIRYLSAPTISRVRRQPGKRKGQRRLDEHINSGSVDRTRSIGHKRLNSCIDYDRLAVRIGESRARMECDVCTRASAGTTGHGKSPTWQSEDGRTGPPVREAWNYGAGL